MSVTTYNQVYFDDLAVKDANQKTPLDKNYLRILFKPGHSVQVRELNQLQSILQTQIDRMGSAVFRTGSAIHGGNCTFDPNIKTVDVELDQNYSESRLANVAELRDNLGVTASVYSYQTFLSTGRTSKVARFYIRYDSAATDATLNTETFLTEYSQNDDTITNSLVEFDSELSESYDTIGQVIGSGYSAGAFLEESIFFINGAFVHTPKQQLFFSDSLLEADVKAQVNGYLYLQYNETVTNYSSDTTLLDNANGTPNYSAPGADRYSIDLTLRFSNTQDFETVENAIKLLTLVNSLVVDTAKGKYSELDRTFARRTYEESGNYSVNPFAITVREFYNNQSNGGRYEFLEIPTSIYTDQDNEEEIRAKAQDRYSLALDPGIAYVEGYRIANENKAELYEIKARGTDHISQQATLASSANVGHYVIGSFGTASTLPTTQFAARTYALQTSASAVIGSCRIRAIEATSTSNKYALFIYDIAMTGSNKFSSAAKVVNSDAGFTFNLDSASLIDANNQSGLYMLPYSTVQNVSELEYYTIRTVDIVDNTFTLQAADETFADSSLTLVRLSDNSITTATGTLTEGAKTISFSGITVSSACLKIKISSSTSTSRLKTKTKTTGQGTYTPLSGTTRYRVVHSDLLKLVAARVGSSSGTDITQYCSIVDDGQRATYYSNAIIDYSGPALSAGAAIWFEYEYLLHEVGGDYFTVNSYSEIDYSEIPSYNGVRLSDVYDFRPLLLVGDTTTNSPAIDPNSVFESSIQYYLPRKDIVTVNSSGRFAIVRGEASLNASEPATPSDAMLLYVLDIPAYTFSTQDIKIKAIDNRRYSMRDIGKLANRINTLEYYTSLSLLEKTAMDKRIIDNNGDRFKNGILVDSFYDHSVGDTKNIGYSCSVDSINGGLTAKQLAKSVPLKTSSLTGVRKHAHSITLDYNETALITQNAASESVSVNPYNVAVFSGTLELLPSTDDWKDTTTSPDIVVNDSGTYDAIISGSNNKFGSIIDEWSTHWFGREVKSNDVNNIQNFRQQKVVALDGTRPQQIKLDSNANKENIGETIIDSSYVPFIRSRKIYFTGKGLKPNSRVWAYFDNKNVTDYCNQLNVIPTKDFDEIDDSDVELYTNITSSDARFKKLPLIVDATGKIYGEFIIPNNSAIKFKAGERILRLISSDTNNPASASTIAEGTYSVSGTTRTVEDTIFSVGRSRSKADRLSQDIDSIEWYSPIAQTFMISDIQEGVFVTSLDLFFSKKSATLPITVQIVTVENGVPTQKVVPFSRVTLDASAVAIDANANSLTRFRFSDPIYLKSNVEYAIVVSSNDSSYRVATATIGAKNIKDGITISKNVYSGTFLTSQNASTWSTNPNQDLKFILNRAVFKNTGTVQYKSSLRGRLSAISVTSAGSNYSSAPTVTIEPPGVTATATSIVKNGTVTSFTITNSGSNYTAAPFVNVAAPTGNGEKRQAKAVAFINSSGTVYKISTATADGGDPGLGYGSIPAVSLTAPGITASATAKINPIDSTIESIQIVNPGSNYRTVPTVTIALPPTGGESARALATAAIEEVDYNGFNLAQTVLTPTKTAINNTLVNSNKTYDGVQFGTNYELNQSSTVTVASQVQLSNQLTTSSNYVSPVIHTQRKSVVFFKNEINNLDAYETTSDAGIGTRTVVNASAIVAGKRYTILTVGSTATNWVELGAANANIGTTFIANSIVPTGDGTAYLEPETSSTPSARYITKEVVLNNSSDQLNVYLDVNRPNSGTAVKLYVKFDDSQTWREISPLHTIPVNSNPSSYSEAQYLATDSDASFTRFTIKIVLLSDNSAFVPKIKDLRVIATV